MQRGNRWEFWIDVGGTFTDLLARDPEGGIRTHKILSTGVVKGSLGKGSTRDQLVLAGRTNDPKNLYVGYRVRLLRGGKAIEAEIPLTSFDPVTCLAKLERPLAEAPAEGTIYELASDEEAPVVGIRWFLGLRLDQPIGPITVRLGTTRGTNALLQRKGAKTAFITTHGFGDILRIGYQNRPKLFDLHIRKPADIYAEVLEVGERLSAKGDVLTPLDEKSLRVGLEELQANGIESLAICFLNSYRNDVHEKAAAALAQTMGFEQVSVSSQLAPAQRIVPRGDTTVVDAYLTPILRQYVRSIRESIPEARLQLMTSAGALVDAEHFVGKDSILSGPAGGVVGIAQVARSAGLDDVVGFDMGGTSTDVCRYAGDFERRYEMEITDPESQSGVRIVAPMLSIETVAAGGGSICWFDGQKLAVGPQSAGSDPGPASYGRGGPLCVTDVNLYLGRVVADRFAFPLDRAAVDARLTEVQQQVESATDKKMSFEELADGFIAIANANMAAAIRKVSVARGFDVRSSTLVSFGGAGGQHACSLARELGVPRVYQHRYAGLLSAFGIGMADVAVFAERHIGAPLDAISTRDLESTLADMEHELRERLLAQSVPAEQIAPADRRIDLRYRGQETALTIPFSSESGANAREFEQRHREYYGFTFPDRPIEVRVVRVSMAGKTQRPAEPAADVQLAHPEAKFSQRAHLDDRWSDVGVYQQADLPPGAVIEGPAILVEPYSTIVIEPGWKAEMTASGDISMVDETGVGAEAIPAGSADPVALELFNRRFASIAEEMGVTLQRTAISTNVKERLDFSCALFTATGDLVVNAPHIPVHLGAMGQTIKSLMQDVEKFHPGDVYLTNDPYRGGSHLPDVTVVTPVFDAASTEVIFFTASRAHHAEIGGITPGSMPPFSQTLGEEGVLISKFRLVADESSSEESLRRLLLDAPFPTRSVDENLADIRAQVAANQTGSKLLHELVERHGWATVAGYMMFIQQASERKVRQCLLKIPEGEHVCESYLDNGSLIKVLVQIVHSASGGEAIVDFAGTGPVVAHNLNANPAIVRAAVLYVFRCLIDEEIPLNDGVLAPVTIKIPENTILHPIPKNEARYWPAVSGGNVETSQRVVDVLLGALRLAAASQGTMNNLVFGRAAVNGTPGFGYYETIGGGAGAGPGFAGASGVHTHMTNTRITDPEVLEARYPVRVVEFKLRRGSGGAGKFPGGDGLVRTIEFLEPLDVSLVTNRRLMAPFGLDGGQSGKQGKNLLLHVGTEVPHTLDPFAQFRANPGDILCLRTPGGGGYGAPDVEKEPTPSDEFIGPRIAAT